ncbi:MAG TPA: lipase [Cytophagales bacterium]|jgi:acetyl esterase/lipase|nr:lipase [Cytophagales bacterium]
MIMIRALLLTMIMLPALAQSQSTSDTTLLNINYYPDSINLREDYYFRDRCVLDLYLPKDSVGFATVVWFHGGGLTGGEKEIPKALKEKGIAVAGVNYRLSPNVKPPEWIKDAAAAVAWVMQNIDKYGGDRNLIFISGRSAGGYLSSMVVLDKSWLKEFGQTPDELAGCIPFSGHAITHFTIRKERGIAGTKPLIDELAPLYHVRKDAPPFLLITGDRELEILGRYEENAYFYRMMKVVGHQDIDLLELDGYDHGMASPAYPLLLNFIKRIIENH